MEFCSSRGNAKKKVYKLLRQKDNNEGIYLFIDLITDNSDTVNDFIEMIRVQKEHPTRLKVIPLICSEYYLLKGLANTRYITYPMIPKWSLAQGLRPVEEDDYRSYVIRTVRAHNLSVIRYKKYSNIKNIDLEECFIPTDTEGWPC